MGAAGSAGAAGFKLLQTGVTGAVEVLTGGGLRAGVGLVRELGEEVENTASHFGAIGKAVGEGATSFAKWAAGIAVIGGSLFELAKISAEDTIQIHALAESMGTSEAQVLQLRQRFGEVGVSMEQLAVFAKTVQTRIQESWTEIQRAVRDAAVPIVQDQLAVQAAFRATEEAAIGLREAAVSTAEALREASEAQGGADRSASEAKVAASEAALDAQEKELDASYKQADADRALAEAQIDASEAVIHQKEAELDAQNKLADAQRAYADAVVNANEAQLNLADEQKNFQYSGDDAYRKLADSIDAVSDAERKAADEANAVYEAVNSVAEAATGVKSAYVSLYAAQLAYREAHGEGRITRAERAELRREQTEVGLESAQERVKSAQFQFEKTARDAVPEAEERQRRAGRGVGAAKEAEDKQQQQFAEAAQRAADKLEKAGSAAAAALERVAKAALAVETAPQQAENERLRAALGVDRADENVERKRLADAQAGQRAADERAKAQLGVESALSNERRTSFEATFATVKAEDALATARLRQKAAVDAVTAADQALTTARNKATDDLNQNINTIGKFIQTGRGPAGFDIRQSTPGAIGQAFIAQSGGGPDAFLHILQDLQKAFQGGIIPIEKLDATLRAVGATRGIITTETEGLFRPGTREHPAARAIVETPSELQDQQGKAIADSLEKAEEFSRDQVEATYKVRDKVDEWGRKLVDKMDVVAKEIAAHPVQAVGEAVAGTAVADIATHVATGLLAGLALSKGAGAIGKGLGAGLDFFGGGLVGPEGFFGRGGGAAPTEAVPEPRAAAGEAVEILHPTTVPKPTYPTTAEALVEPPKPVEAPKIEAPTAPGGASIGGFLSDLSKGLEAILPAFQLLQGLASGQKGVADIHQKAMQESGEKPLTKDELLDALQREAGLKPEPATPEAPKAEDAKTGPAASRFAEAVAKFGADVDKFGEITGVGGKSKAGEGIEAIAAKLEEIVAKLGASSEKSGDKLDDAATKLDDAAEKLAGAADKIGAGGDISGKLIDLVDKITQSRAHEGSGDADVGGGKLGVAADKLEEAAIGLEEAATKIGSAAGAGGIGAPEPGHRTGKEADDAIGQIKESIDKLVSGKGLIQPPETGTRERASYDESVRHLLDSITEVNKAQAGLIAEQERATAETERLTKEQEQLTAAQTEKVKTEAQDEEQLTQAQVDKLRQESSDGHEIAQAQEGLLQAQADLVRAQTAKVQAGGGHASGGIIKSSITGDNVPIMATSGEFVVNVDATAKNRQLLETINDGKTPHFAVGGSVGSATQAPSSAAGVAQKGVDTLVTSMTQLVDKQDQLVDRQLAVTQETEKLVQDQSRLVEAQIAHADQQKTAGGGQAASSAQEKARDTLADSAPGGVVSRGAPSVGVGTGVVGPTQEDRAVQADARQRQESGDEGTTAAPPTGGLVQPQSTGPLKDVDYDAQGKPMIPGAKYRQEGKGWKIAPPEDQLTPAAKAAARAEQSSVIKSVDEVPSAPQTHAPPPTVPREGKMAEAAKPQRVHVREHYSEETLKEMYPGGHPPLSLDSPLRRRAEGYPVQGPKQDVTTTLPNVEPRPEGPSNVGERQQIVQHIVGSLSQALKGVGTSGGEQMKNVAGELAKEHAEKGKEAAAKHEDAAAKQKAAADDQKAAAADNKAAAAALKAAADKPAPQPAAHASGGPVMGAGGPKEDNIPIMASAGEYVVNADFDLQAPQPSRSHQRRR